MSWKSSYYFNRFGREIGSMVPGVTHVVVVKRIGARVFHSGHVILVEFVEHFLGQRQRFALVLPSPSD